MQPTITFGLVIMCTFSLIHVYMDININILYMCDYVCIYVNVRRERGREIDKHEQITSNDTCWRLRLQQSRRNVTYKWHIMHIYFRKKCDEQLISMKKTLATQTFRPCVRHEPMTFSNMSPWLSIGCLISFGLLTCWPSRHHEAIQSISRWLRRIFRCFWAKR